MESTAVTLPRLLTQQELADYLKRSVSGIEKMRERGVGPRHIRVGRLIRYPADDLKAWLEQGGDQ